MSKIEEFKTFVKDNPSLIKFVKNNEMTWQKFYEIYDIYGNEESAWSEFISKDKKIDEPIIENSKNNPLEDLIFGLGLIYLKHFFKYLRGNFNYLKFCIFSLVNSAFYFIILGWRG